MALIEDPEQRDSSQYFHILRSPDAGQRMSEDGFRRTFSMFEKFSATPWLDDDRRAMYRRAWSMPGRLNAMLNWYRASPIIVPRPGEPVPPTPLKDAPPERFTVEAPHLLIWGQGDVALRASSTEGLERFAPLLRRVAIPQGDHWVIHTHGKQIAAEMAAFISEIETKAR